MVWFKKNPHKFKLPLPPLRHIGKKLASATMTKSNCLSFLSTNFSVGGLCSLDRFTVGYMRMTEWSETRLIDIGYPLPQIQRLNASLPPNGK